MPGRKYTNGSGYRYGFNGKENDKDAGEGIQDYGMRIYDTRLGKFLSLDPLTKSYPWFTPYQFAGNIPIWCIDLDGMEPAPGMMQAGQNEIQSTLAKDALKGDKKALAAYNQMINADFKVASIQFGIALTIASAGTSGSIGTVLLKKMVVGGLTGATINSAMSYAQGENGYEIVKSGVSGFFSGAVLGAYGSKINSLKGLLISGSSSGATGEFVEQTFDNTFGNGVGTYDLQKIMISGGIGAVANLLSSKIIDNIYKGINKKVMESIRHSESKSYRELIRDAIRKESPRITPGKLKKAVNERLRDIQNLVKKQGEIEKIALKQVIERTVDYLQDKALK